MHLNITQPKIAGFLKSALTVFIFLSLFTSKINAQTYVNGNLSTGAVAENGTAAPAGYTWSEVQHNAGDLTLANNSIGNGATGANSIADDFIVPAGQTWALSKVTVYGYSTGFTGTTSPFTQLFVRIHSGSPLAGPTTIVFGDLTTNRMSATSDAMMYRISNTVAPVTGPPPAPGTTRKIWKIEANVSVALPPGTYWLEYRMTAGTLGNFAPLSTPLGVRTLPGYNAIQFTGTWAQMFDLGFPTTGPDVAVDMPFSIDYAVAGACTGTPAPGNTISSAAAVCPNQPFTLSLQNNPAVSGLTYQWQSSATGTAGSFTNIAGATGSSLSIPNLPATTYYQAVVTCAGTPGTSTPVQVSLNPPSACYCTPPNSDCTDGDIITNVRLNTLNNTSTCNSPSGYTNYTTNTAITVPDVIRGAANSMSVTAGGGLFTEHVGVWIDYDKSGTFDASEFQYFGSTTGGTLTANLNVPTTAQLGTTRMRVRVRFNTTLTGANACLGYAFGETEDYTVNIVPCVPGVITTSPVSVTIGCNGNATFTAGATGSLLVYAWEYRVNATSPWLFVPNTAPYSGANTATLTVSNASQALNGYQFRAMVTGACSGSDFTNAATLTVGPLVGTVTPTSANICAGAIQQLSITNTGSPATSSFSSGPISVAIPDNNPAPATVAQSTIPVTLPAGSLITGINVRFTMPHTWAGDVVMVLQAPNGARLNLLYFLSGTGGAGATTGFTNTVISSTGTAFISTGASPYTGTFRADAAALVATPPSGPAGFLPTVTAWTGLFSVPNGNWTLAMYDGGAADVGTLTSWAIEFTYGAPASGVWTGSNIFTNAAGTTPYVAGTPASTVWVRPTATETYTVTVSNPICVAAPVNIPVNVYTAISDVNNVSTTITSCNGNDATLSVTAGSGTIQNTVWQVSTNGGATFTNVPNGAPYSGVTTTTLTITDAPSSLNGNLYRAQVSNPCNTVFSDTVSFTVNPNPEIVLSANPLTELMPGQTTTLSAAVSPNPGAVYNWYKDGVLVSTGTSNTLVVGIDDLGLYTVTVDDVNNCNNTSNSILISEASNDIVFIYPSPNTGVFQVRYQGNNGINFLPRTVMMNVYDSKGARVYSRQYTLNVPYERMDVDMTKHGKGVYVVELVDNTGIRIKAGRVSIF